VYEIPGVRKIARTGALLFFLSFVALPPLFAANPPPNIPPGQDAGSQDKRFLDKSAEVQLRATRKREKPPAIEIEEKKVPALPKSEATFVLTDVKITGVTLFEPEDLRPLYQPYLQKKITLDDAAAIADQIKGKYHNRGFLTTSVYFPEQEIENGVIEIAVLEGKLGQVTVEGNKWFSSDFVRKYIHANPHELLNINKLQKDILRLNKFSDLEVKTIISPGKEKETSDLVLKVKDKFPWHVGMSEDDRGSRLTGKYNTGFYLRGSNVLGLGDTVFANSLISAGSFGQVLSYLVPIGTFGAKLGFDLSYFQMKLGKEIREYHVTGKTKGVTPHVSFELALKESFEAYLDTGVKMLDIQKRVAGNRTSDDQLRIPYVGFNISQTDTFGGGGQTGFSPQFSLGTGGFLGASKSCHPSGSRDGTGGFYFKYEHDLRRTQAMPYGSYLLLNSKLQAASHTLSSAEQLQLGGMTSVRGYPEGDYLADVGATLNMDWVFPSFFFPKNWKMPFSKMPLRRAIEPVLFFDMGGGGLYAVNPGERGRKFLVGAGGGLRVHIANNFFIRLEWAKAFGNAPQGGNGPSTFYMMMQSEA
jgi:hemolysin activation/secretion protein